jgi:5-methylthioribose kinase
VLDLVADKRAEIEALLRENDWLAAAERISTLTPAGEGNMNRTLRATLATRTLILKQSVPFVAKYPDIAAPADRIAVEAAFYRATATTPAVAGRMPRVLGFDAAHRLLALEDLGAGADFTDVYGAPAGEALARHIPALLDWLSALHAVPVPTGAAAAVFANRAMRELNHAHIFDIPFRPDNGLDLDRITAGLDRIARALAADASLKARIATLGEVYLGHSASASAAALLHGDFYPGSWLRNQERGVCIIDPEFAFIGAPEFDVGVFLAHLCFARTATDQLLEHYRPPPGFSLELAYAFAGVEVLRRLLGVAQLPLAADIETKRSWVETARRWLAAI